MLTNRQTSEIDQVIDCLTFLFILFTSYDDLNYFNSVAFDNIFLNPESPLRALLMKAKTGILFKIKVWVKTKSIGDS